MCIIVDTNTLGSVFNKKASNHAEFKPVLDWILEGRGKFVYGGTKYLEEIGENILDFLAELGRTRKSVKFDNQVVDEKEAWAASQIQHSDFDDQHLVGLLMVSGCKLICSLDERAYPFFRHTIFFSPAANRPKIYNQKGNADLLIDINIADCCKPTAKLTVKQKETLTLIQ